MPLTLVYRLALFAAFRPALRSGPIGGEGAPEAGSGDPALPSTGRHPCIAVAVPAVVLSHTLTSGDPEPSVGQGLEIPRVQVGTIRLGWNISS